MKLCDRFAVVSSTAGSVLEYVLERDSDFRRRLKLVVTDRSCGAERVAIKFSIRHVRIDELSGIDFSNCLQKVLTEESIGAAFLFFSRILSGPILEKFSGQLINFHPSLLPAFPGLRGFEDGWDSGNSLLGSSVHFIDCGVDTGPVIQQAFFSVNRATDPRPAVRHKIFLQQCASLSQVSDWVARSRVVMLNGKEAVVRGASYETIDAFVPALEKPAAIAMAAAVSKS